MKIIEYITKAISQMRELQIPVNIEIGSFKVISRGSLHNCAGRYGEYTDSITKFSIIFRPDHIQRLLNLGVKIDLNNCKMSGLSEKALRFKEGREAIKQGRYAPYYYMGNPNNNQTGVIENWLIADASCSPETLYKLKPFSRDNHRDCINIDNDTNNKTGGWSNKEHYSSFIKKSDTLFNAKAIRKNIADKKKKGTDLLPIEKRSMNL